MGTPDKLRGPDALTNLPIQDVLVPKEVAMWRLTYKAVSALQKNCTVALAWVQENRPKDKRTIQSITEWRDDPRLILRPGGLFLKNEGLNTIYSQPPNVTYTDILRIGMDDVIDGIRDPKLLSGRNPGIACVSFMQDMAEIVDPKMAGYKDIVTTMLKTWRKGRYYPTVFDGAIVLGGMLDDTITRKTMVEGVPDYFADSDGAAILRDAMIVCGSRVEQMGLSIGLEVPREWFMQNLIDQQFSQN